MMIPICILIWPLINGIIEICFEIKVFNKYGINITPSVSYIFLALPIRLIFKNKKNGSNSKSR